MEYFLNSDISFNMDPKVLKLTYVVDLVESFLTVPKLRGNRHVFGSYRIFYSVRFDIKRLRLYFYSNNPLLKYYWPLLNI